MENNDRAIIVCKCASSICGYQCTTTIEEIYKGGQRVCPECGEDMELERIKIINKPRPPKGDIHVQYRDGKRR